MHVSSVKELLKNTDLKFTEIARQLDISPKTVQNINNGKTHHDDSLSYPIRVTGKMLGELKSRLSKPTKAAVPRPDVLSPQMMDYVGILSLLGNDLSCLLIFKGAYERPLEDIFKRKLTDDEILSIIYLEPSKPAQLKTLIDAFKNPKVKFINTQYWIDSGFIRAEEENSISSLFK